VSSGLGEPGYYRPEKFTMRPYTRKDSVAYEAQLAELNALPADTTTFRDEAGRVLPRVTAAVATSTKPSAKLAADATPIGTYVRHTYREQSKSGRITRDSGEFVVYQNAQVVPLMPRRIREARLKQLRAQKQ
jgi:hypothetical protein